MKKADTVGNRTRDLSASSTVPQPTAQVFQFADDRTPVLLEVLRDLIQNGRKLLEGKLFRIKFV